MARPFVGRYESSRFDFRVRFSSWPFCTALHSFPQLNFQISLAKERPEVYGHSQIEPGSLKDLTAQLKEGAAVARPLRPQSFFSPACKASF
jgi:hypothetical protein